MYAVLICIYTFQLLRYGSTKADEIGYVSVSMNIIKSGFHREVETTVEFGPEVPNCLDAMLSYSLPGGVYIDPYQLASLREDRDLQMLLNSTIDTEAPAHTSVGFTALVYPSLVGGRLKSTIPIHGRYHKPSLNARDNFKLVDIELPTLMLKMDKCTQVPLLLPPHSVVDAPCTASNTSTCQWMKIQHSPEEKRHSSVELPCGDGSLVEPVCAGTLLVTMLCCGALSRSILRIKLPTH